MDNDKTQEQINEELRKEILELQLEVKDLRNLFWDFARKNAPSYLGRGITGF